MTTQYDFKTQLHMVILYKIEVYENGDKEIEEILLQSSDDTSKFYRDIENSNREFDEINIIKSYFE